MINDKGILIKNIFYMLSYAYTPLTRHGYRKIATEKFKDLYDLFAAVLAAGIGSQLKQGLYREYVSRGEDLPVLHGKINLPGTIRSRLTQKQLLACEFDELAENNLLNQIIKATVMLLIRHPDVRKEHKNDLKKEMFFFSRVTAVDPSAIKWPLVSFHRYNETYRMLIGICRLTLDGLLMTTESGKRRLARLLVDEEGVLSAVYENFIRAYYKKEYPALDAKVSVINWAVSGCSSDGLPEMKTDITLRKDKNILIIDAKYYSRIMQQHFAGGSEKFSTANLYQIFAYVKNMAAEADKKDCRVSGMLLYAKTKDVKDINSEYNVTGNKIYIRTLDLNREFYGRGGIKEQLDNIVTQCL